MAVQSIPGPSNIGNMWVWLIVFVVVAIYATTRGKQRKGRSRRRRGGISKDQLGLAVQLTLCIWVFIGFLSALAVKLSVVEIIAVAVGNFILVAWLLTSS